MTREGVATENNVALFSLSLADTCMYRCIYTCMYTCMYRCIYCSFYLDHWERYSLPDY